MIYVFIYIHTLALTYLFSDCLYILLFEGCQAELTSKHFIVCHLFKWGNQVEIVFVSPRNNRSVVISTGCTWLHTNRHCKDSWSHAQSEFLRHSARRESPSGQCTDALRSTHLDAPWHVNQCNILAVFQPPGGQAIVVSRLSYAFPHAAWWGFASMADRNRLESFLRRSARLEYRDKIIIHWWSSWQWTVRPIL